jgi:hypothetical protein
MGLLLHHCISTGRLQKYAEVFEREHAIRTAVNTSSLCEHFRIKLYRINRSLYNVYIWITCYENL